MAYITLAEFKSYHTDLTGGVPAAYTGAEDATLTTFINQAQAEIERITNRKFESSTQTRYYTAGDVEGKSLYLDADLLTVTSITNGDGTTINTNDAWLLPFNFTPKNIITLKSSESWAFNTDGRIAIAGTWGFSTTAPDDIKRLCLRLAWFYWMKRSASGETTVLGEGGAQVAAAYPADIADALKRYKRQGVL